MKNSQVLLRQVSEPMRGTYLHRENCAVRNKKSKPRLKYLLKISIQCVWLRSTSLTWCLVTATGRGQVVRQHRAHNLQYGFIYTPGHYTSIYTPDQGTLNHGPKPHLARVVYLYFVISRFLDLWYLISPDQIIWDQCYDLRIFSRYVSILWITCLSKHKLYKGKYSRSSHRENLSNENPKIMISIVISSCWIQLRCIVEITARISILFVWLHKTKIIDIIYKLLILYHEFLWILFLIFNGHTVILEKISFLSRIWFDFPPSTRSNIEKI